MRDLRYTFVSDGSSDRMLMPVIEWLLASHVRVALEGQWADLARLPRPPKTLAEQIRRATELYPCDVLFVHRDAEGVARSKRVEEIRTARAGCADPPAVCVVPVRMAEAWILFDEAALRSAAGNPRGRAPLALPPLHRIELLPDPKAALHEALRKACDLRGRHLQRFEPRAAVHRLARGIEDFSPLRALPAFRSLEEEVVSLTRGPLAPLIGVA